MIISTMRRHRLYCPVLKAGSNTLSPEESHHAVTALRAKAGQEVILFDGAGRESTGVVIRTDRRNMTVEAAALTTRPFDSAYRITLAVAMGRAHRQGYLIEKCTELGVAAVWPIVTERSVSQPNASAVSRWSRRAVEAAKQSGRAWLPAIEPPTTFAQAVQLVSRFHASAFAQTGPALTPFVAFLAAQPASSSILVWIGPEGGWSDSEQILAQEAGVTLVSLGPVVLRTETAAVAACAAAMLSP